VDHHLDEAGALVTTGWVGAAVDDGAGTADPDEVSAAAVVDEFDLAGRDTAPG